MSTRIARFDVHCETCLVVISLSVISTTPTEDDNDVRLVQALNELLVDYGWQPTRSGRYCRNHAIGTRR